MEENINRIVDRVKELKHLKSDDDVAKVLEMKKTALSNHKTRKTIPFKNLSTFCDKTGFSLDYILTGEGPKFRIKKGSANNPATEGKLFINVSSEPDSETIEIIDLINNYLPELKEYLLKFLRGTKERKEGAAGLGISDKNSFINDLTKALDTTNEFLKSEDKGDSDKGSRQL